MTAKQKTTLRTVFGDRYRPSKDVEITQEGTEVPTSDVEEIVATAKRLGVTLIPVEPEAKADKAATTNEAERTGS